MKLATRQPQWLRDYKAALRLAKRPLHPKLYTQSAPLVDQETCRDILGILRRVRFKRGSQGKHLLALACTVFALGSREEDDHPADFYPNQLLALLAALEERLEQDAAVPR